MNLTAHINKAGRKLSQTALTVLLALAFTTTAHAACTNPTGTAGQIDYNEDENVLQYCDTNYWMPMYIEHYWANAVNFDGTNDYLNETLTGVSNSKRMTVSLWFRRARNTFCTGNSTLQIR